MLFDSIDYFIQFVVENDILTMIILIFTIVEINQSRKARTGDILYNIFHNIHNTDFLKEVEWFYNFDTSKQYNTISPENIRRADDVIDTFTRISFLCNKRVISYNDISRMYSGLIIHIWKHAYPYVTSKRKYSGVNNYACYFEELYYRAYEYRSDNSLNTIIR